MQIREIRSGYGYDENLNQTQIHPVKNNSVARALAVVAILR